MRSNWKTVICRGDLSRAHGLPFFSYFSSTNSAIFYFVGTNYTIFYFVGTNSTNFYFVGTNYTNFYFVGTNYTNFYFVGTNYTILMLPHRFVSGDLTVTGYNIYRDGGLIGTVGSTDVAVVVRNADAPVSIYSLGGELVAAAPAGNAYLPVKQGTYIAKVGGKAFKLIVK